MKFDIENKDSSIRENLNAFAGNKWVVKGLGWGFFMFIFVDVIFTSLFLGDLITLKRALFGSVSWAIAGLILFYVMKLYYDKKLAS